MNIFKVAIDYRHLKLFKRNLHNVYELKKKDLLDANKKENDTKLEHRLVIEINLLAKILGKEPVNEEAISSVRFYPGKCK